MFDDKSFGESCLVFLALIVGAVVLVGLLEWLEWWLAHHLTLIQYVAIGVGSLFLYAFVKAAWKSR